MGDLSKRSIGTPSATPLTPPGGRRLDLAPPLPGPDLSTDEFPHHHSLLAGVVTTFDACAITLGSLVALSIGPRAAELVTGASPIAPGQGPASLAAVVVAALTFLMFPRRRSLLYFPAIREPLSQIRFVVPALLAGSVLACIVLVLLREPVHAAARAALAWLAICGGTLLVVRGIETVVLHHARVVERLTRRIAIIGTGEVATALAERIADTGSVAHSLAGIFDDDALSLGTPGVSGNIADLIHLSRENSLRAIIIAIPPTEDHDERVKQLSWRLRSVLADVYVMPYLVHGMDMALPVEHIGPHPVMVLQRRPLTDFQTMQKTVLDLIMGSIALLILSPLLLLVAALVKLDSKGPVFFRQPRLGYNNRPFTVFKFRSMYTEMSDTMAARQTSRDDPRVTRVGKWLRRLSIDELPQLLNVLTGDMSLVGPRPHAPHTRAGGLLLDDALAEYVIRHQVKPGITGWAQINGSRGELVTIEDLEKRVRLDLEYIQRWSVGFDLRIMVLTALREVFSRNAF